MTLAVAVVVMSATAPAWGQQSTADGDKRREVERELELARASNAKVESEVERLNQAVTRQARPWPRSARPRMRPMLRWRRRSAEWATSKIGRVRRGPSSPGGR